MVDLNSLPLVPPVLVIFNPTFVIKHICIFEILSKQFLLSNKTKTADSFQNSALPYILGSSNMAKCLDWIWLYDIYGSRITTKTQDKPSGQSRLLFRLVFSYCCYIFNVLNFIVIFWWNTIQDCGIFYLFTCAFLLQQYLQCIFFLHPYKNIQEPINLLSSSLRVFLRVQILCGIYIQRKTTCQPFLQNLRLFCNKPMRKKLKWATAVQSTATVGSRSLSNNPESTGFWVSGWCLVLYLTKQNVLGLNWAFYTCEYVLGSECAALFGVAWFK